MSSRARRPAAAPSCIAFVAGISALAAVAGLLAPPPAAAATYYVAPPPAGNDGNPGSAGSPWATLQHAADTIGPGDTVLVRAGQYAAFEVSIVGSQALPVVFRAAPGALVELVTNLAGRGVGVNVEQASWVTIEGFRANNRAVAGFRAAESDHVTFRGNVARDNGTWGIFTGCVDDVVIEGNLASGSCNEHGIYVSNSGDRPRIAGNVVFDNDKNGIHMNGDASIDCTGTDNDGRISNAVVENNLIFDNGHGQCSGGGGGSGVNGDGVTSSVIRNNVIWNAHHSGISLYQIDAGGPAVNNRVLGNTVHVAADGRWAVNLVNGATGTLLRDNILWSDHGFRGAIVASADSMGGLSSDYNAVEDSLSPDGDVTILTLVQWRAQTGQDIHSFVATPASLVQNAAGGDYRPKAGSLALNTGLAHAELTRDLEGTPRPQGAAHDIGAYEGVGAIFRDGFDGGSVVRWSSVLGDGPF